MATNNIVIFGENSMPNIQTIANYNASLFRKNGFAVGDKIPTDLLNRLFHQLSLMSAALGQFIADKGYNVTDTGGGGTELTNAKNALANALASLTVSSANKLTTARTLITNLASTTEASFDGSANKELGVKGILPLANGGTNSNRGNAPTATKLDTARTLITNLASTTEASFDGSANKELGVKGTLSKANGGTGNTTGTAAYADRLTNGQTITVTLKGKASGTGSATFTGNGACNINIDVTNITGATTTSVVTSTTTTASSSTTSRPSSTSSTSTPTPSVDTAVWYISQSAGNDNNSGHAETAPLKTFSKFMSLINASTYSNSNVTLYLLSDQYFDDITWSITNSKITHINILAKSGVASNTSGSLVRGRWVFTKYPMYTLVKNIYFGHTTSASFTDGRDATAVLVNGYIDSSHVVYFESCIFEENTTYTGKPTACSCIVDSKSATIVIRGNSTIKCSGNSTYFYHFAMQSDKNGTLQAQINIEGTLDISGAYTGIPGGGCNAGVLQVNGEIILNPTCRVVNNATGVRAHITSGTLNTNGKTCTGIWGNQAFTRLNTSTCFCY